MVVIAPVLMAVVLLYWLALCATIWFWGNALFALLKGHFIRASIWFSLGCGALFWWQGSDLIPDPWDFDKWLRGSTVIVGIGALGTLLRFLRKWKAMQAVPAWTAPPEATGNIGPIIEVEYRRLSN